MHDGALLDFDFREVKVAQAIIANARHVILVSDKTKFERTAPVRIGHLSQVEHLHHRPLPAAVHPRGSAPRTEVDLDRGTSA
jgi:DeoR/GlpR family transcriptional regulator of sugar metabolism